MLNITSKVSKKREYNHLLKLIKFTELLYRFGIVSSVYSYDKNEQNS
jgi:hypothetical protein